MGTQLGGGGHNRIQVRNIICEADASVNCERTCSMRENSLCGGSRLSGKPGQALGVRSSEAQSESKNFFIPSQYFRTTNSVLKCPPRRRDFRVTPVSFANRTLPSYGTCGSSIA
jgi:hypothetical protein